MIVLSFSTDWMKSKQKMIEDVGKYSTDTSGVNIDPDDFETLSDSVELAIRQCSYKDRHNSIR